MTRFAQEMWIMFAVAVGMLTLIVAIVWFMSYNEAASYRKYCDTPVTTWDAIFLDLRIDECEKCDE